MPSSHLQVDIMILGVSLILLVLSFTCYLCAIALQNTPSESHWSPSVAGPCVWGQYLCCSVTILVNFLTLTCCFKIPYNMGALELDFGFFFPLSRWNGVWLVSCSHLLFESALSNTYHWGTAVTFWDSANVGCPHWCSQTSLSGRSTTFCWLRRGSFCPSQSWCGNVKGLSWS